MHVITGNRSLLKGAEGGSRAQPPPPTQQQLLPLLSRLLIVPLQSMDLRPAEAQDGGESLPAQQLPGAEPQLLL